MKTFRILVLVATALLTANFTFAQTWTQTSAPITNWTSIASSADGNRLVAATSHSGIWVSSDSGMTWTQTSAPILDWPAVACSADGMKLVALGYRTFPLLGWVCTSINSGVTWTSNNVPNVPWRSVISSADGNILAALTSRAVLYTSTNSGTDWTTNSLPSGVWHAAASSADGSTFVLSGSGICISTNSGSSWTLTNPLNATAIAASASATRLVAVEGNSIYISTNSGFTWAQTTAPVTNWISVASSADGAKLVAVAVADRYLRDPPPPNPPGLAGGPIYTSSDFGLTWVSNNVPSQPWNFVTASADGTKLFAVVSGGGIWTAHTTPTPQMNITPTNGNLALSWVIPSTNFVLQQNFDLTATNWTDVTNPPLLNLTNLQDEVTLPLTGGNCFYRLATP